MNRFFRYHLDHVLFWTLTVGFHAYTRIDLIDRAGVLQFALEILLRNALLAAVIYFNLWVVIPRIGKGNVPAWLLASIASVVAYALIKNLHDVYLYRHMISHATGITFYTNTFYNFSIVLFYLAFAGALHLSKQWYVQRELLRQAQLDRLNTELEYLKAQMNPHFLFNSINTIFFQINKENTEARETLGKFSDMLRYQLYECNADLIPIEKEVDYLKNYVALQQLRKDERYDINFQTDSLQGFSIPPLLLIPFVENAFKHFSNFPNRVNYIHIALRKHDQMLELVVTNSVDTPAVHDGGGIGLRNVQRRLELLYPGKHWLSLEKNASVFSVNLKFLLT